MGGEVYLLDEEHVGGAGVHLSHATRITFILRHISWHARPAKYNDLFLSLILSFRFSTSSAFRISFNYLHWDHCRYQFKQYQSNSSTYIWSCDPCVVVTEMFSLLIKHTLLSQIHFTQIMGNTRELQFKLSKNGQITGKYKLNLKTKSRLQTLSVCCYCLNTINVCVWYFLKSSRTVVIYLLWNISKDNLSPIHSVLRG